jgi:hypothetical protein
MNKEQQELLDEAYENYLNNFIKTIESYDTKNNTIFRN